MTTSPSITPRPSTSTQGSGNDMPVPLNNGGRSGYATPDRKDSASLGLPTALKPIGIMNEQNTCFLNSTFQALSATGPLISLLHASPSGPLIPAPLSLLPPPVISSSRIPALIPEAAEPPIYPLLPVTKTFLASLQKAWKMKDAGGGTSGAGETSNTRSMRLQHLLREMARKYDQYDDYMQQDAHELLRHLLDSMEMEEKDVIKRVQPPIPGAEKKKNKYPDGISPLPSAVNSPAPSQPPSPTKTTFSSALGPGPAPPESIETLGAGGGAVPREIPENERLVPFVDVLFGGLLASVVVCEHCKSVSHTYEGFLDISLSLKGDAPRMRKRDKLKAAFGFKSKAPVRTGSISESVNSSVMSESELSDTEARYHQEIERDRRRSFDQDDRQSGDDSLKRNSSMTQKFGLKGSFGFRKKPSKSSMTSSPVNDVERTPPTTSIPGSPNTFLRHHGPGPTPAQSAYISRILWAPPNSHQIEDPLAKLRAANAGEGTAVNDKTVQLTGLEESLRAFTSVEVLEGDNAFACRKCWKIKSGKYQTHHATVPEEDEGMETSSPSLMPSHRPPPSISIVGSDSASDVSVPAPEDNRLGRASSAFSRTSATSLSQRASSPLRRLIDESPESHLSSKKGYADSFVSADSAITVDPEGESDGLSETSSSDDELPAHVDMPLGVRPKLPSRRKSSHFVMRRAFKRYLIAQPPEVLVFHFKRFKQTHKSGLTFTSFYDLKKMDDFISFPETLDLAPYLAPNRNDYKAHPTPTGLHAPYMDWPSPEHGPPTQTPVLYRLYALVVHLGSMIGGHYIAYVLVDSEVMFKTDAVPSGTDGELANGLRKISIPDAERESRPDNLPKKDRRVWCYCSDTSIRLASVEEVLAAKAYICFYEKVPVGKE